MSVGMGRESTVRDDWHAALPEERRAVYAAQVVEWEHGYAMLSVALSDAFQLRATGRLLAARQQAGCAGELAGRLAEQLLPVLGAVQRGSHWGDRLPAVDSLRPGLFRWAEARECAFWSSLLHVPLSYRPWQFALKLHSLRATLQMVTGEFHEAANEIAEGICTDPQERWEGLEALHDDLNTVLREVLIVLKSFLCAASERGWADFRARLTADAGALSLPARGGLSQASP